MDSHDSSLKDWFKRSGREALGLAIRLALVIVAAVVAGILLLLLYVQNTTVNLVIFGITSTVSIGLLAGFLSRWILKRSTPMLRFLVAAVALFVGLAVMYLVSSGMMGLSPYIRSSIDWYGLIQIGIGLLAAFIALNAFRRKASPVEVEVPASMEPIPHTAIQPLAASPAAVAVIAPAAPRVRRSASKRSKAAPKKAAENSKVVVGRKSSAKAAPASKKARRKVTLEAFDEHRCPYCLEEVKRNDPRGVVICPICKAYHHKDCWDITGRCQVPHDNPL